MSEKRYDIGNKYCEECGEYYHVELSYDENGNEPELGIKGLHLHLSHGSGEVIVNLPEETVFVVRPEHLVEIGKALTPRIKQMEKLGFVEK